ncbi:TPA: single-stranded DNA-binding protein, partial [Escherichia coli]|nr:single-stranded DNA-binding protein [Escherichia coli]
MTAQIAAYGRLVADPQLKTTSKGTQMTMASMAGNMQVSQWTGQNGETRQGWQVIADSVISARTARPGGKKGQQGQATDALN